MRCSPLRLLALSLSLLAAGCKTCEPAQGQGTACDKLGPALMRLSNAVEAAVAFHGLPDTADERQILADASKDDHGLLAPFDGYALRVRRQGTHAVVLVCDAAGQRVLLEDAGCTGPVDRAVCAPASMPCAFTLDPALVCAKPAPKP